MSPNLEYAHLEVIKAAKRFPLGRIALRTRRGPIRIDGNAQFVAANGVVGGTGTQADPYRIENWSITVEGESILDQVPAVWISNTDQHFVVRDVTIRTSGWGSQGILIVDVSNGTIERCGFQEADSCVLLQRVTSFVVADCTIECNGGFDTAGVYASESSEVRITGNRITGARSYAVGLYQAQACLVRGNDIREGGTGISASESEDCSIEANQVRGGSSFDSCGIRLYKARRMKILDNRLTDGSSGVSVAECRSAEVGRNSLENVYGSGIHFYKTQNSRAVQNSVRGNHGWDGSGIGVSNCSRVQLVQNHVVDHSQGVSVGSSSCVVIAHNRISDNEGTLGGGGVSVYASRRILIRDNRLQRNGGHSEYSPEGDEGGFALAYIGGGHGLHLAATARDVQVYHNVFDSNYIQAQDFGTTNTWDNGYPAGGNYWSDYGGTDVKRGGDQQTSGEDGIGDTAREFYQGRGRDRYPLMEPPTYRVSLFKPKLRERELRSSPPLPEPLAFPAGCEAISVGKGGAGLFRELWGTQKNLVRGRTKASRKAKGRRAASKRA